MSSINHLDHLLNQLKSERLLSKRLFFPLREMDDFQVFNLPSETPGESSFPYEKSAMDDLRKATITEVDENGEVKI